MTAARKGWCPALLTPMTSGDGLLARVKPMGARLAAQAARAIAEAAARYGNGHLDLTNRANLQIRGLRPETVQPFAAVVFAHGLASADAAVEQVRNVMASPLGRDDPEAAFDSHAVACAIEEVLAGQRELAALPSKFGFLVDAGGALPLDGVRADIIVRAHEGRLAVFLDGTDIAAVCALKEVADAVRRLALAFLDLARTLPEPPRRMCGLVEAVGAERIFAAAGLTAEPTLPSAKSGRRSCVGFVDCGDGIGALGAGLPFGQIGAEALAALAGLAARHGDGTLRTTPWRALLLPGIRIADAETVAVSVRDLGLITDRNDARLSIAACVGKTACASASVDARADAAWIAGAGVAAPLHISGCAKGCAHPRASETTLVGREGLYDLVRNGRAGDAPALRGLTIEQAMAALHGMHGKAS